jgi:taurine dioxygenase
MEIRKLSDISGIEVRDIDLANRSAEEDREIGRLYNEYGLVVFKDQKLTQEQLLTVGAPFGGTMTNRPSDLEYKALPGIILVTPTGDVAPDDPEKIYGGIEWHTDQAYVAAPTRGKMLYAVEVPEVGGMTGFIDGEHTYNALPDAMKARIENLHVIQSWNKPKEYIESQHRYLPAGQKKVPIGKFPDMAYALAPTHPITGRKTLNLPPLWAAGILEMPGAEGDALLEELKQHATQEKFQYWHSYTVGDELFWDNWRFLHAAGGTPGRYNRLLWGIAIKGGHIFGRPLSEVA